MAFSDYKSLAQVQEEFLIRSEEANFVVVRSIEISDFFREEFNFNLTTMDVFASEAARCEIIIFPILREIYKRYYHHTALWVQKSFSAGDKLSGTPDYMLSKKSELGKNVLGLPLLLLVEAKRNDFELGWGQCLAELVAADKLNQHSRVVYGIVTDGASWDFGRLSHQVFTREPNRYSFSDLDLLFGMLNGFFELAIVDL